MQFYTKTHPHYCGVDLNTKTMHVRFLDPSGYILIHRNMRTDPNRLWSFTAPRLATWRSAGVIYEVPIS